MNILKAICYRLNRKNIYSSKEYWDEKALEYTESSVSMWPNKELNKEYFKEQIQVIESTLKKNKDNTVLDIGCGTGRISKHLAINGFSVTAVDFSENAIHIAKISNSHKNVTYRVGSVFDLDIKQQYDYVLCLGVLTVACKDESELIFALKIIKKHLKPHGSLILIEPFHNGFLHRVLKLSKKKVRNVINELNISIIKETEIHFWPTRLILCFINYPVIFTNQLSSIGRFFLRLFPNMGDYKVFICKRR